MLLQAVRAGEAAACRDQVRVLQAVLHKQFVDSRKDEDVDVLAAIEADGLTCVNIAMVRGGRHLGDRPQFPSGAAVSGAVDSLLAFVEQHYSQHPIPARILVNLPPEAVKETLAEITERPPGVVSPRFEAEKAWMEMAEKNAHLAIQARARDTGRIEQRLEALREALGMDEAPQRIECFDISHTMGEATVASCVVCEAGAMKRAEYRRYNIAGITGGDDFAAMRQALERRYGKVAAGEGVCPDLILIDGRFRLGCFLSAVLCTTRPVTILWDDYKGRGGYMAAERWFPVAEMIGRMARFEIAPRAYGNGDFAAMLPGFFSSR